MSLTNCRFYEEKYPDIDSFVMVNVRQVRRDRVQWLGHLTKASDMVRTQRSQRWEHM